MNTYLEALDKYINGNRFVRCFCGKCPKCGTRIFSVGDNVIKDNKIVAEFICECGKRYKEIVYSAKKGRYRYPQALVETITDKEYGEINALKFKGRYIFIKDGIMQYRQI